MLDLLKDILKVVFGGLMLLLVPVAMVIGGGALIGFGIDNDWSIVVYIGGALLIAGLVWGALLFMYHSS